MVDIWNLDGKTVKFDNTQSHGSTYRLKGWHKCKFNGENYVFMNLNENSGLEVIPRAVSPHYEILGDDTHDSNLAFGKSEVFWINQAS